MYSLLIQWSLFLVCGALVQYEPQQVHIATNVSTHMTIVWNTESKTNESIVLFGKTRNFTDRASGVSHELTNGMLSKRSQYVHKVIVSGLEPSTRYYYVVGSLKLGLSDVFTFKTWPAENSKWSPRFAVYGDLGNVNAQSLPRIQLDVDDGMYDAIIHVGDFAYDMDWDHGKVGDAFMRQIEPIASQLPYMTCPGNHEYANNFSNYRSRFSMPGDENKRMYYSFTMGLIRFISLDTEALFNTIFTGFGPVMTQYEWLKNELKIANLPENRAKQPWLITFGHRPMYCSNKPETECMSVANPIRIGLPKFQIPGWEDLLYDNGVDLAFWAHEHSFERMWPVYNHTVLNGSSEYPYTNPKAPVHIVTGSAGCQEKIHPFSTDLPPWSAFHSTDYGYTRMEVKNATHLYLQQVSDDQNGKIIDRITLIKDKHGPYRL